MAIVLIVVVWEEFAIVLLLMIWALVVDSRVSVVIVVVVLSSMVYVGSVEREFEVFVKARIHVRWPDGDGDHVFGFCRSLEPQAAG